VIVDTKQAMFTGPSAEAVEALSAQKQEPGWMRDRRRAAWKLSETLSLPTGSEEEWRRTDLRGVNIMDFQPLPAPEQMVQNRAALPKSLVSHMGLPETTSGGLVLHQDGSVRWRTQREKTG
jgi:Fe-S cluster assembly protein SufD